MKTGTGKAMLTGGTLLLAMMLAACETNPIDAALDEALDFSGFFQAGDGTEIELNGSGAIVRKVGSTPFSIPLGVGNPYMMHMYPTSTPGEFQGYVVGKTGLLDRGTVVNPAGGEWHILLYGYHEYYGTSLKVTISR